MRLRTFTAQTTADAMEQVRTTLGDDAIIVSTYNGKRGRDVQVTAAVDESDDHEVVSDSPEPALSNDSNPIDDGLRFHRVPQLLASRLSRESRDIPHGDQTMALAAAIDSVFEFSPLPLKSSQPIMLVGPPGAGKTVTAAKLLARATLAGHKVAAISTDTVRAGGVAQISAFTTILDCPLFTSGSPEEFGTTLSDCRNADLVVVDTPGTNPLNRGELADLERFVDVAMVDPVLVMAAGAEAEDAREMAQTFASAGVQRLVGTRLDVARRYGGLLAAADSGPLALSEVSVTPYIAEGLHPVNPVSIARLLLEELAETGEHIFENEKAAE